MAEKNAAAVELGRMGGKARSERKTATCRENGRRGGRPAARERWVVYMASGFGYRGIHVFGSASGALESLRKRFHDPEMDWGWLDEKGGEIVGKSFGRYVKVADIAKE